MSFRINPRSDPRGAPLVPVPDAPPWPAVALALGLALLLQTSAAPFVTLRNAAPAFVLLIVAWYGLRTDALGGFVAGAIAGACEDALAGTTGAAWMIATALCGVIAGAAAGTVVSESRTWLVPFVAGLTLLRAALFAVAMRFEGLPLSLPVAHAHQALWQAAFDAVLAFVLLTFVPRVRVSRVGLR